MTRLNRRTFTTGFTAGLLALGLSPRIAGATSPLPPIHFDVRIAGARVGHHHLDFRLEDGDLLVSIDVAIKVKILFATVFDYRQTATERWRDGRLIGFDSETQDGDNLDRVTARAVDDGQISVRSKRFGDRIVSGDIWPSTAFWRPAAIRRTAFLDGARGDIREVSITGKGRDNISTPDGERFAQRYHVSSSRSFDVWYGLDGDWLGLEWSGFGLTAKYRRK